MTGRPDPIWRPITVGTLSLSHRLVVPPHGGGNGNLMGDNGQFELAGAHPDVRVIGDAYAPRRTVFATRLAWATMLDLN